MVILLTAPLALVGGLFALLAFNISLNIYSQIALVLLLGLATKNGILIVEFTNQLPDQGYASYHALVSATQLRLRPILRPQSPPLQEPFRLSSQAVQGRNPLYPWDCTVLWCGILNLVEPVYYSKCLCTHCQNSGSPLASTHKLVKTLKENKQQPTN